MREEVQRLNAFLRQAEIEWNDHLRSHGRWVDASDRQLKRIFNNGQFTSGGRLFGGFWQPLPKGLRLQGLTIAGETVVELDYGQIALRTLYGLEGHPVPDGDLYAIPGLERWREGIKTLINALLFSDQPRRRKPKGTKRTLPPTVPVHQLVQRIREVHEPVQHRFETEIGYHLQFKESEVMMGLLLRLMNEGIVALPIHDAVLAPCSSREQVKTAMEQVFRERIGVDAVISEVGQGLG